MDIFKILEEAASQGLEFLADKLAELASEEDDAVKTFILGRIALGVEQHGASAVGLARVQFEALLNGKHLDPVAVRQLPLHERGPLLAASLRRDLDAKAVADAVLLDIGDALGTILRGLVDGTSV